MEMKPTEPASQEQRIAALENMLAFVIARLRRVSPEVHADLMHDLTALRWNSGGPAHDPLGQLPLHGEVAQAIAAEDEALAVALDLGHREAADAAEPRHPEAAPLSRHRRKPVRRRPTGTR